MNDATSNLADDRFPRASLYDPERLIRNQMGPNVLWLTEYLTNAMDLHAGMRVLDLGCGKALSSVFLAREFGVQVWAADLWIDADDNARRIQEAGLGDQIVPVHAEAHALPFDEDFFDAVVSVDAYHYFGTDDLYLGYLLRFLKPEGTAGMVVPGVIKELAGDVPEYLRPHWVWDFCSFHSAAWWRTHWEKTGLAQVTAADWMPDGAALWLRWEEAVLRATGTDHLLNLDLLRADAGRTLGLVRAVAQRHSEPLYRT